jgi:hypothetical protein
MAYRWSCRLYRSGTEGASSRGSVATSPDTRACRASNHNTSIDKTGPRLQSPPEAKQQN